MGQTLQFIKIRGTRRVSRRANLFASGSKSRVFCNMGYNPWGLDCNHSQPSLGIGRSDFRKSFVSCLTIINLITGLKLLPF